MAYCSKSNRTKVAVSNDSCKQKRESIGKSCLLKNEIRRYGLDAVTGALVYSDVTETDKKQKLYRRFNHIIGSNASSNSFHQMDLIDVSYAAFFETLFNMQEHTPVVLTTLYRGCDMPLSLHIGLTFTIGYFVSTSTSREVAIQFLQHSGDKMSPNKYLFEYSGPLFGIDMVSMSNFPYEREILLFPCQTFMIVGIFQHNDYTVIKLHSQYEKAVQMLKEISFHFSDTKLLLTQFQQQSSKAVLTLFEDSTNNSYMICNTSLKHYNSMFLEKPVDKTLVNSDSSLPNSHVFVVRQLINHDNPFFNWINQNLLKNALGFFWNFDMFYSHFITFIPNISILKKSINTNDTPVYCKVQTEVHAAGGIIYNEPDCFVYRFSSDEIRHLYNLCIENDKCSNATSFIISKKMPLLNAELYKNSKIFNQMFTKTNYPQIKVAHVDKEWNDHYKNNAMFVIHFNYLSFFLENNTFINFLIFLFCFIVFSNFSLFFVVWVPLDYVKLIIPLHSIVIRCFLLFATIIRLTYVFEELLAKIDIVTDLPSFFLCKKCNKRCNQTCETK